MKKTGKPHLPVEAFFNLLGSLKNEVGWVQAPGGYSLLKFLSEKAGIGQPTALKKLDELVKLGYIQKDFRGNIFWRIKILISEWDENRLPKKQKKGKSKPIITQAPSIARTENQQAISVPMPELPKPTKQSKPQEKRFAVFMDYVNLEKNLKNSPERFRDFSWLLNPILEQGKLIFAFVFIPDHYVSRVSIMQLTHKHNFHAIFCPRKMSGVVTKDADTVDAQLIALARSIIDHSDVTDIVVISGDADFQRLINYAIWQQKSVTVNSAAAAVSGRFLEMGKDGSISVQLTS